MAENLEAIIYDSPITDTYCIVTAANEDIAAQSYISKAST